MRRALFLLVLAPAALVAPACGADGATEDDFDYGLDASGIRRDGGGDARADGGDAGDAGSRADGAFDGSAIRDGASTEADGSIPPSDAAPRDAGVDGGVDSGPPLPDPCAFSAPCASGRGIGSVRGDTGTDFLTTTGTSSEWILVRVTEDNNSITDLRVRFRLIHDANTRFDLYLYKAGDSGGGTRNCSSVSATGARTSTTNVASASLSWSDNWFGSDDTRNVMVEVRHVSGPCGAARPWTLEVDGNAT